MVNKSKLELLKSYIKNLNKICIAFSGGVDSTFLLKIAINVLGKNVLAVIVNSKFMPGEEFEFAKSYLEENDIDYEIVYFDIFKYKNIINNPKDRCYYCKYKIFKQIIEIANKKGYDIIADGSNKDDVSDYRPGSKAALELGIISPLKEFGINKKEIRYYSKMMGLVTWDKPSFACLASRIPYNTKIDENSLKMIEMGESLINELGFTQYRLRHHGDIARIELLESEMNNILNNNIRREIIKEFKNLGYDYITIDLEGYRMGSLNKKEVK